MSLIDDLTYQQDLKQVADLPLPFDRLNHKTILITGATGMIGSYLIDLLMRMNQTDHRGIQIIALGRDLDKAKHRFPTYFTDPLFRFVAGDINDASAFKTIDTADFILHAASNTHPLLYASDPIGTMMTNLIGTQHLLDLAVRCHTERFLFVSSVEVYGENTGQTDKFTETSFGYIDCNTLRAGYPESKRAGEALCQAYLKQHGLDIVIPRLPRIYGPTMLMSDSKALSQFIKNSLNGQDIVLKSEGTQYYSYAYVADAVSGVLTILLLGKNGQAYNIADAHSDITLRDLAQKLAALSNTKVIFDLPSEAERSGFSKATKALLDSTKLQTLGWKAQVDLDEGLQRTLSILKPKP